MSKVNRSILLGRLTQLKLSKLLIKFDPLIFGNLAENFPIQKSSTKYCVRLKLTLLTIFQITFMHLLFFVVLVSQRILVAGFNNLQQHWVSFSEFFVIESGVTIFLFNSTLQLHFDDPEVIAYSFQVVKISNFCFSSLVFDFNNGGL